MTQLIETTYINRRGLAQLREEYPASKGYFFKVETIELNYIKVTIYKH